MSVTITMEDPSQSEIIKLVEELDRYQRGLYPPESNHLLDLESLRKPDVTFITAKKKQTLVGCGAIKFYGQDYGELKRIYVDPQVRGNGIGMRIMRYLEQVATAQRVMLLRLETGIHNAEALRLYAKAGFTKIGRFGDYPDDPLSIFMEKKLELILTQIPRFTLRFAGPEDIPLILQFIKGLADYEKLARHVVATEELLAETLFGQRRVAEVIIGDYEGEPVSFALFFHNFSTFLGRPGLYLEDLYVLPEMRGQALGQAMLAYLAKLAVERGCGRLEWGVLDWNEPAVGFYKKLGAVAMDEWTVFRIHGPSLNRLAAEFDSL